MSSEQTTSYQMVINNAAAYIRSEENRKAIALDKGTDVFMLSKGIAIGFCKNEQEVVMDICMAKLK